VRSSLFLATANKPHSNPPTPTPTPKKITPKACADLGIPVRLTPPLLSQIDEWQGAFISSTSRLLLPADELRWQPPEQPSEPPSECTEGGQRVRVFPEQHGLVRRLEVAVMEGILAESEEVAAGG